jgi:formimidoylglutamate deiminase
MYAHINRVKAGRIVADIWAEQALLPEGWAQDVAITIGADGRISAVSPGVAARGPRVEILLPAPANLHSHAFQRAMAGLTETRGPNPGDSFWTWRQLMFRFLDRLTPDHVQAIAAFVQMEMLEAGYACNVEFHYLHHRPGGVPYDRLAEMAERIAAAAGETGIGLTLLPVHYQFGGCDGRLLGPGQIRFGTTPDMFLRLHEESVAALRGLPRDTASGIAPHSLRAVSVEGLRAVTAGAKGPLHMHLAEQKAEVAEVLAARGARPVEWMLGNMPVGPEWCFIHLTQMTEAETLALAPTGAVAGLCPITEANLGDGIFDGVRWMGAGGRIGIGSDSNIRIGLSEELRQLDHSQRLRDNSRAALALPGVSTGRRVFDGTVAGGAQAAGRGAGGIAVGQWADLMALDGTAVDLAGRTGDTVLDAFVFSGSDRMIRDVWAAGRHQVRDGRHVAREAILAAYRKVMRDLRDAL